jgi:hypothetical protein
MRYFGKLIPGAWVRAGFAAVIMLVVFVAPASAAAPSNDKFAGATVIPSLPFNQTEDTTQATTDADDVEANANCGAPATQASVWFSLTPAADETPLVDVSNSDYEAGVIVVTGTPGNFSLVACGPGQVAFSASAGVTYSLLAFGDESTSTGGQLNISVSEAPPPPKLKVTVNPVAAVDKGLVTLTGTITCKGSAVFGPEMQFSLKQKVARLTIFGKGSVDLSPCSGGTQSWTANLKGKDGKFGPGRARVIVSIDACGTLDCSFAQARALIKLRR